MSQKNKQPAAAQARKRQQKVARRRARVAQGRSGKGLAVEIEKGSKTLGKLLEKATPNLDQEYIKAVSKKRRLTVEDLLKPKTKEDAGAAPKG